MAKQHSLNRSITFYPLVLYGVGTILGAGVYALIGKIAAVSGRYAPVSFILSAVIAGLVALIYAELSSRYPKSAGEAVYIQHAFKSRWLTACVGWGVVMTGIVSSGVMAHGFAGYLLELITLPDNIIIIGFVLLISFVTITGISLSVTVVTVVTLVEISGILLMLYVCWEPLQAISGHWRELLPPLTWPVWQNIILGAFLAFYAFIGFEDMVNIAEEVMAPERTLPAAIVFALLLTALLYALVSLAAVMSLPISKLAGHNAPFALILAANSNIPTEVISIISLIAIINGALVQIIMGSRVIYGMAEQGLAPKVFGQIHPRTRTPVNATVIFSLVLMALALWLPIVPLAELTSFIILLIFALISLSLWLIKQREQQQTAQHFHAPTLVPVLSLLLCLGLIIIKLWSS